MKEKEFKKFLEDSPKNYSASSINSSISGARRVEVILATHLDEIVVNDETMFKALYLLEKDENYSKYMENSLRLYYEFKNYKKFPSLLHIYGTYGFMKRVNQY